MAQAILQGMDVRERLLQAAVRVFEESGSRGATTRRIAAEAGVNEITLFRHFGSKSALLGEALAEAGSTEVETGLPDEPRGEEPLCVDRARRSEDVRRGTVPDLRLEDVRAGEVVLLGLVVALEHLVQ